ncbi:unnamed protein product [Brugia timori]|uniref:Uncharacterized protein n=1 Tax=Brugia timori TaxID=42155 RepID=A0A3P7WJT2_9BILA|nr:unnamed protein product [Brugia timori]
MKDFVTFSQQIETELDKELNAANLSLSKREKEIAVLIQERDRYKEEIQRFRAEQYSKDMKLNDELQELRAEKENLLNAVHKLEQKNDDLERELRITCETLKDTERKLNEELEMRALLITELDSKEDLKVSSSRLSDFQRLRLVERDSSNKCILDKLEEGIIRRFIEYAKIVTCWLVE